MKFLAITLLVAVFSWFFVNYYFAERIPRTAETKDSMSSAEIRIQAYVSKYHRLPERLAEVPKRPEHNDNNFDGWGMPLIYDPQPDGSVVLRSQGKDGGNDARSIRFSIIDIENEADEIAETITFVNMGNIESEIRRYSEAQHRLPSSLLDLPQPIPNFTNDGWERPLSYSPQVDGSVILISHGKPGSNQIFSSQFQVPGISQAVPSTGATQSSRSGN